MHDKVACGVESEGGLEKGVTRPGFRRERWLSGDQTDLLFSSDS